MKTLFQLAALMVACVMFGSFSDIASAQCNVQQQQSSASSASALQNLAVLQALQAQSNVPVRSSAASASAVASPFAALPAANSVGQLRVLAVPQQQFVLQSVPAVSAGSTSAAAAAVSPPVQAIDPLSVATLSNVGGCSGGNCNGGGLLSRLTPRRNTSKSVAITRTSSR